MNHVIRIDLVFVILLCQDHWDFFEILLFHYILLTSKSLPEAPQFGSYRLRLSKLLGGHTKQKYVHYKFYYFHTFNTFNIRIFSQLHDGSRSNIPTASLRPRHPHPP